MWSAYCFTFASAKGTNFLSTFNYLSLTHLPRKCLLYSIVCPCKCTLPCHLMNCDHFSHPLPPCILCLTSIRRNLCVLSPSFFLLSRLIYPSHIIIHFHSTLHQFISCHLVSRALSQTPLFRLNHMHNCIDITIASKPVLREKNCSLVWIISLTTVNILNTLFQMHAALISSYLILFLSLSLLAFAIFTNFNIHLDQLQLITRSLSPLSSSFFLSFPNSND